MPKATARIKKDYAGGKLINPPATNVYANNKQIAIKGQLVAPHPPCGQPGGIAHCVATITGHSYTVYVNRKGVARKKDKASCGDKITSGSPTVYAG